MKQSNQESLSALMDGELSSEQLRFLLRGLEHDPELRETWARYHLIRHGLRREGVLMTDRGFADGVMARLDASESRRHHTWRHRWLHWSAGGVMVAGMAALALIALQPHTRSINPTSTLGARPMAAVRTAATAANRSATVMPSAPPARAWLSADTPYWITRPVAAPSRYSGGNMLTPIAYSQPSAPSYMSLRYTPQPHALGAKAQIPYMSLKSAQSPASPRSRLH